MATALAAADAVAEAPAAALAVAPAEVPAVPVLPDPGTQAAIPAATPPVPIRARTSRATQDPPDQAVVVIEVLEGCGGRRVEPVHRGHSGRGSVTGRVTR